MLSWAPSKGVQYKQNRNVTAIVSSVSLDTFHLELWSFLLSLNKCHLNVGYQNFYIWQKYLVSLIKASSLLTWDYFFLNLLLVLRFLLQDVYVKFCIIVLLYISTSLTQFHQPSLTCISKENTKYQYLHEQYRCSKIILYGIQ